MSLSAVPGSFLISIPPESWDQPSNPINFFPESRKIATELEAQVLKHGKGKYLCEPLLFFIGISVPRFWFERKKLEVSTATKSLVKHLGVKGTCLSLGD